MYFASRTAAISTFLGRCEARSKQHRNYVTRTFIALAFLWFCSLTTAHATYLTGPFVAGSGSYTLLPNGDFETGNTSGWEDIASFLGTFRASNEIAYSGAFSVKTNSTTFSGPGYASGQIITGLTVGQTYVLSGFFNTGGLSSPNMYLDLDDIQNDLQIQPPSGISEWQFGYDTFIAATDSVRVRIVRDGNVTSGEAGYIDDVAVTPLASFTAPIVAPEPGTLVIIFPTVCVLGMLIAYRYSTLDNTKLLVPRG